MQLRLCWNVSRTSRRGGQWSDLSGDKRRIDCGGQKSGKVRESTDFFRIWKLVSLIKCAVGAGFLRR